MALTIKRALGTDVQGYRVYKRTVYQAHNDTIVRWRQGNLVAFVLVEHINCFGYASGYTFGYTWSGSWNISNALSKWMLLFRGLGDWKSTQADTKWNQDKFRKRWCYLGHLANKDPDTTSYHEMKII